MKFKSNIIEMSISRRSPIYLQQTSLLSASYRWDPKENRYRSSLNFSYRNTRGQINIIRHLNIFMHSYMHTHAHRLMALHVTFGTFSIKLSKGEGGRRERAI